MASSLVGRASDLAELERRFAQGAQLVTLLGPAGVGKTHLAKAFAAARASDFADLSQARDAFDACRAIARQADVLLPESLTVEEALAALTTKLEGHFIVLDNFEQLLPGARGLAEALAASARLLITSRERLRLKDEVVVDLAPLDEESARALFVERVRAVRSDFSPNERELATIDEICRELDRLPLAIELAAPRLRVASAAELLDRLSRRFDLLAEPDRSLRGALDWSWGLLDANERRLLAECTVFAGDFGLDAAEAVLSPAGDVLQALQSLRDKSLLHGRHTELGARFGLYTSIREYAALHLPPDDGVHERYADHYLALGFRWAARAEGPEALSSLAHLLAEQENLLSIHRRAIEIADADRALRAAVALQPLLIARGPAALRLQLIESALALVDADTHPRLVGWAKLALGDTLFGMGKMADSVAALEAARSLGEREADQRLVGRCAWRIAEVFRARGQTEAAAARLEEALEIHRRVGDKVHEGRCLVSMGATQLDLGQLDLASELFERALERLEEVFDLHWVAHTLAYLASVEESRGSADEARELYHQAIELHDRCGNRRNLSSALGALAALETELGNLERAKLGFDRALEVSKGVPDQRVEGLLQLQLGVWYERQGDRATAHRCHRNALGLLRPIENDMLVAVALAHLARTEPRVQSAEERLAEAKATSDHPGARALIEIVSAQLSLATAPEAAQRLLAAPPPPTPLLRRALDQLRDAQAGGLPARALVVGAGWFKLPGGTRVEIGARRAPALLLAALARARVSGSGRGLGVDELFQAGWPGERASVRAAASRVYVAISSLRKLGLGHLIIRNEEGYHLDPAVPIVEK